MARTANPTCCGHSAKEWAAVAQKFVKLGIKIRKLSKNVGLMLQDSDEVPVADEAEVVEEVPVKRKPGRPKKVVEEAAPAPKKRGRPRKEVSIDDED